MKVVQDAGDFAELKERRWPAHAEIMRAEALRALLWARGKSSRRNLLNQARLLLFGELEPWRETCEALEARGDFLTGSHGALAASPLRFVRIDSQLWRIIGGPESRALHADLVPAIDRLCSSEILETLRKNIPFLELTPEDYSGLAQAPLANQEFLNSLNEDLSQASQQGPEPLDLIHSEWQVFSEGRWQNFSGISESPLWRRSSWGNWWNYHWTPPPSLGAQRQSIPITRDDAIRAQFALNRLESRAQQQKFLRGPSEILWKAPFLPGPEYRSTLARALGTTESGLLRFSLQAFSELRIILEDRLGLSFSEGTKQA